MATKHLSIWTEGLAFFRPDLVAVRQRITEYNMNAGAVTDLIDAGAPIADIRVAYKRLRLEIKIAHADATRRADDLTQAERAYWQPAITEAAGHLLASAESDDAIAIRRSLHEAHAAFVDALSMIGEAMKSPSPS